MAREIAREMTYPTHEEVQNASYSKLCSWYEDLPRAGDNSIGHYNFNTIALEESRIMERIEERIKDYSK